MPSGCIIKQLTFVNFGDQNINQSKQFRNLTNYSSDPIIFEALRSLLDRNYLNDKVTKPENAEIDSYVELTYEWRGQEYKLKRVFGSNGRILLNGIRVEQVPDCVLRPHEPQYDAPPIITDQMISEFFRRRLDTEHSVHALAQLLRMSDDNDPMAITLMGIPDIEDRINADLLYHKQIEEQQWKWIVSRNNPTAKDDEYYLEVKKIIPATPNDEFHFRDAFVNISLASLQFNITANQRDLFDRLLKEIKCEDTAYGDDFPIPYGLEQMEKTARMSRKLEQHEAAQLDFYTQNINIVTKYKEKFLTYDEWQVEKDNMSIVEETQFHNELSHAERNLTAADDAVLEKSVNIETTITDLRRNMNGDNVNAIKTALLERLTSYIGDNVMASLQEFPDVLCKVLNNPMLDIANISKGIAGSVHSMANNAEGALNPEFIFDHVSSSDDRRGEHLLNYLQTYLAPLSNVQFTDTAQHAIDLIEAIQGEPNDESCKTTFIFAAHEKIAPGQAPGVNERRRRRLLTIIPREFRYGDTFTDLLSNCGITCDKKLDKKDENLVNLGTKRMVLANNERAFVTKSEYLFQLLRLIGYNYDTIGKYLLAAEEFRINFDAGDWQDILNSYYDIESQLLTEMMERLLVVFEKQSIADQKNAIKSLTHRSTSRMKIHDQLLSLEYTDGCDDLRFVETLSQRQHDTLQMELWFIDSSDAIPLLDDEFTAHIYALRKRQDGIEHFVTATNEIWQQEYERLSVEPNGDDVSKRLSTIASIDFLLCSRYFRGHALIQKIPIGKRTKNSSTLQDNFNVIDFCVSQLNYPKGSPARLERCKEIISAFKKRQNTTPNKIKVTDNILTRLDYNIRGTINNLCSTITHVVRKFYNDQNYNFSCQRMNDLLESVTPTAFTRRIFFKGTRREERGEVYCLGMEDFIATSIYAFFIQKFTESPIILDEIMEGFTNEETVAKSFLIIIEKNVTDRFALVRIPSEFSFSAGGNLVDVDDRRQRAGQGMNINEPIVDPGVDQEQRVESDQDMDVDNDAQSDGDQGMNIDEPIVDPGVDQEQRVESDQDMDVDNDAQSDGDQGMNIDEPIVDPGVDQEQRVESDQGMDDTQSDGDQNVGPD